MANVLTHYGKATLVCLSNNGITNNANRTARLQCIYCQVEAVKCSLGYCLGFLAYLSDQKCFRLITMPTVHDAGQVDVDYIALTELFVTRNSMTNDIIDARAATLWVA